MPLQTTKSAIIRAAEQALLREQAKARVPKVVWMRLDGTMPALPPGRVLLACPYGASVPPRGGAVDVQPVYFSPKLFRLLHPDAVAPNGDTPRYVVGSGGRGSGKSHGFATAIVLRMLGGKLRVLCAREIQKSLRESVHYLTESKIDTLGLTGFFDVTDRSISCRVTGSEMIFTGLFANVSTLRSLEDIGLCWIEEGESVSAESLRVLQPTIRGDASQILITLNPDDEEAPVQQFCNGTRDDTLHDHFIFSDNPWFTRALELERAYLQRVDDDAYQHVWLGKCRVISDAVIFARRFVVEDFEPQNHWSMYQGCDFGFANDPSAAVRCYVADRTLYISHEFWGLHVELDRLSNAVEAAIPGSRQHQLLCDNSRPETINHLKSHGHPNAVAAPKWPGSIEDGISFIRAFEKIVVHSRCRYMLDELRAYQYKIDRLTQKPLPEPEDRNNHLCDALRYALSGLIRGNGATGYLQWLQREVDNQNAASAKDAAAERRLPFQVPNAKVSDI